MFKVGALTGFGGGGGGPLTIVGTIAGDVSTTPGTTHNMGSMDVGVSNGGKKCLLGITTEDDAAHDVTAVTIGGVSLSQVRDTGTSSGEYVRAEIWGGGISSINGSSAIVITTDNTVSSVAVSGVARHNLNSLTEQDGANHSGTGTVRTLTALSGPAGGIVFAIAVTSARTDTAAWSSMTERADLQTGGGSDDHRHTSAWDLGDRASADETITFSTSTTQASSGASFR